MKHIPRYFAAQAECVCAWECGQCCMGVATVTADAMGVSNDDTPTDRSTALSNEAHMCTVLPWPDRLKAFLDQHPEVNVDYKDAIGYTCLHNTSMARETASVALLLDHRADINGQAPSGNTSLILALHVRSVETALVIMQRGADVHIRNKFDEDALSRSLLKNVTPITWVLLCCSADARRVPIKSPVTQAKVIDAVAEYRSVQAYIKITHQLLKKTLSGILREYTNASRGDVGIYQEPLELTLEYLGLSMRADQVVNTSIDGRERKRVLIPHQPRNAKHWFDKFHLRRSQIQVKIEEHHKQIDIHLRHVAALRKGMTAPCQLL
jgi:hypothetical protein